jgi:hypothetical protein
MPEPVAEDNESAINSASRLGMPIPDKDTQDRGYSRGLCSMMRVVLRTQAFKSGDGASRYSEPRAWLQIWVSCRTTWRRYNSCISRRQIWMNNGRRRLNRFASGCDIRTTLPAFTRGLRDLQVSSPSLRGLRRGLTNTETSQSEMRRTATKMLALRETEYGVQMATARADTGAAKATVFSDDASSRTDEVSRHRCLVGSISVACTTCSG